MSERLYPVPDDSRTPWCFLVVQSESASDEHCITGWELVIGNANQIIGQEEMMNVTQKNEEEILSDLMNILDLYQHSGTTLYTFDKTPLFLLRARLFLVDSIDSPSLRGFQYVSLREVLELFGPWWEDVLNDVCGSTKQESDGSNPSAIQDRTISAQDLWQIRCQLAPLIPVEKLEGYPL